MADSGHALAGVRYSIRAGGYRAVISDVGAGLAGLSLAADGTDRPITLANPPDVLPPKSSGTVLMPWPNRIRDGRYRFDGVDYQLPLTEPAQLNASHGLVKWVRFSVAEQVEDSIRLTTDGVAQVGYPFELHYEIRYTVSADSGLAVHVRVENVGPRAAPFGAGFHPYLELGDSDLVHAVVKVPATSVIMVDDRSIPVQTVPVEGTPYDLSKLRPLGSLRLDHAFTDLTGDRVLVQSGRTRTEVWWDESFHVVQVFTPPEVLPGRPAIAVEPLTCPANAFNTGEHLLRLEPGEHWRGAWGIRAELR